MAVRSGAEGGAGAPGGHRITGDPTRGCRGAPVGACAWGPLARAMIATGLAQGDLGRPHRPPGAAGAGRPCRARSAAGPAWGGVYRRAAAQAAARARLARPKIRKPAPIRPCASGSSTRPGDRGRSQGGSPPVCGSRTPMMGACASVTSRSTQGPGCVQGAGSLRAQLRVEGALRTGRTRRTPALPTGRRSPSPGARSRIPGRRPPVCARPRGDEGAVPGHWEADPIIAGRPPAAP